MVLLHVLLEVPLAVGLLPQPPSHKIICNGNINENLPKNFATEVMGRTVCIMIFIVKITKTVSEPLSHNPKVLWEYLWWRSEDTLLHWQPSDRGTVLLGTDMQGVPGPVPQTACFFLEIPSLHFPNWQQFGQLAPKHAADIWRGDRGLGKWRAMIPCRGYNCRVGGVTSSSAASPSGLLHRSTKVFNLLFILTYAKLCLKLKIYKIMYFQVTSSLLLFYRSSR